jgi:hypothetical protein
MVNRPWLSRMGWPIPCHQRRALLRPARPPLCGHLKLLWELGPGLANHKFDNLVLSDPKEEKLHR